MLRLGEKRTRQLQDLVGPTQLLNLAFDLLRPLGLAGRNSFAHAVVDLVAIDSFVERLRHPADLRCIDSMAAHSDG